MRALALLLLAAQLGSGAENWARVPSEPRFAKEYARSKAACRRVSDPQPPLADQPTAAQRRALKGCSSETLYYGARPDFARARMCAFVEGDEARDSVFGADAMLMQLYANGLGVKRNLDLATAYACTLEGAPAERDGRVNHLQDMKAKPSAKRFDYCDDITSGLAGGFCSARDSDLQAVGRGARFKALEARIAPAARTAYAALRKAHAAFVDTHGDGEVDQSGTGRATFVIEAEDAERDRFAADLALLLGGRWPPASPAQAQAADAALNAMYRRALSEIAKGESGTVTPDGVRKAQRAWIAYRDAFTRFAAAAPGVGSAAVAARLTTARTAQLEAWLP